MGKVMMSIQSDHGAPTVPELVREYQLSLEDVDQQFGVIEVDDVEHKYTFLVEHAVASYIKSNEKWTVEGPFSNPPIGTTGPPDAK